MPVFHPSTTSEHSLLQGNADGRDLSSPWKIKRERIIDDDDDDERPSSMSERDMVGPGLHQRPDWPFAASHADGSVEHHNETAAASSRANGTTGRELLDESVEEDGDEDEDGEQRRTGAPRKDGRDVSPQDDNVEEYEDRFRAATPRPLHQYAPAISPVREEADIASLDDSPDEDEIMTSHASPKGYSAQRDRSEVSPVGSLQEVLGNAPGRQEEHTANGYHAVSPSEEDHPNHSTQQDQEKWEESESEGEAAEDRDSAPPTHPPRAARQSQERQRPHTDITVPVNIQAPPLANGHHTRNSFATQPSHSRRSSSTPHTREISHNKDRVRYSWQSLQDDEPNRPRIHIIKLVSNTVTASAGFPQAEAFGFSISPSGRRIAAYNSARLYVLQTAALPIGISQDYSLKRRPLAVEVVDDGDVLAILADEHTVNIYDLGHQRLKRSRTIKMDFPTNCIALAPTGGLLATAYEGGVEIFSLSSGALSTDRRAVRCERVDRLTFSEDGSTLLGTTTRVNASSTMVVSVPVFPASPDGVPTHDELKEAWCTELLHPENIRNSSHATFLREKRRTINDRVFAWNGLEDTFGVLNVADLQYGSTDFPVVITPPLSTCGGLGAAIHSCPAIDEHGDTVAMVVNDRTVRLYIVPRNVDDKETTVEAHSIDHELDEGYGCPFSEARWVYSSALLPAPASNHTLVRGRLVVTSPGGILEPGLNPEEIVDDIEGGRIIMFDFDPQFAGQPGQTFNLTLGKSPPQLLDEAEITVADEVALVRRRTVNQSKSGGLSHRPVSLGRTASTVHKDRDVQNPRYAYGQIPHPRSMLHTDPLQPEAGQSLPDLAESFEMPDQAIEDPYAQNAPRSYASLQRAASNAQRHRYQTLEERSRENGSVDTNGPFLALPEYTEEPNAPLPSRFRAMAGLNTTSGAPSFAKPDFALTANRVTAGSVPPAILSPPTSAPVATTGDSGPGREFEHAAMHGFSRMPSTRQQQQSRIPVAVRSLSPVARSISPAVDRPLSPVEPRGDSPGQNGTFDPLKPMPRGLQRAYSNAMTVTSNQHAPGLGGEWDNGNPAAHHPLHPSLAPARSSILRSGAMVPEDEPWDLISPVGDRRTTGSFGGSIHSVSQAASLRASHYSTSLLDPPGHTEHLQRAPSTASSFATIMTTGSNDSVPTGGRRLPLHVQAFRNAAAAHANSNLTAGNNAASSAASLFPPKQAAHHIPVRVPQDRSGEVGHPITAWHPPAASNSRGSMRGLHVRKSSSLHRITTTAFPVEEQSKRLGFFKSTNRRKKVSSQAPNGYPPSRQQQRSGHGWQEGDGDSKIEEGSVATWTNKREGKCLVM